tara:strand:+ start:13062 stop:13751 length:690 start_codon:yes stop_codon:yes gene_type:complete
MKNVSKDSDEFAKLMTAYLEERPSIIDHHVDNDKCPPLSSFSNTDLTYEDIVAKTYVTMMVCLDDAWRKLDKAGIKGGPLNTKGVRIFVADLNYEQIALGCEFKNPISKKLRDKVQKEMSKDGPSGMFTTEATFSTNGNGDGEFTLSDGSTINKKEMLVEMEQMIDELTSKDLDIAKQMMKRLLRAFSDSPTNKMLEKIGVEMDEKAIIRANFDDLEVEVDLPDKLPQA